MNPIDCPFQAADRLAEEALGETPILIVDFHAEATSEKMAMAAYLDGRATAVIGTHPHGPTADAQLRPGGTAYVTDLGMVGPTESIIGVEIEPAVERFLTGMPPRLRVAERSPMVQFNSVVIDIDETTGRARSISRVDREYEREGEKW